MEPTWANLNQLEPTSGQLGAYLVHFSANLSQLGAILSTENLEKSMIFIDYTLSDLPGPAECAERLNTASPLPGSAVPDLVAVCRSRNPYLLPRSEVCCQRAFRRTNLFSRNPKKSNLLRASLKTPFSLIFIAFCNILLSELDFAPISAQKSSISNPSPPFSA